MNSIDELIVISLLGALLLRYYPCAFVMHFESNIYIYICIHIYIYIYMYTEIDIDPSEFNKHPPHVAAYCICISRALQKWQYD